MLSIITPVYNEEAYITSFLENLMYCIQNTVLITEIILVNGESTDDTGKKIEERIDAYTWPIALCLLHSKKSRAIQQNVWVIHAKGEIIFFLHVDCLPEPWFETKIITQYKQWHKWWVCHFRRTPQKRRTHLIDRAYNHTRSYRCRFGDSGIIITKQLFWEIGWFDEAMIIEEDHLILMKLRKRKSYTLFPIQLYVSDRLFRTNWFVKTLSIYTIIHGLFLCGVWQDKLLTLLRHIKWQKNLSSSITQTHESEMQ